MFVLGKEVQKNKMSSKEKVNKRKIVTKVGWVGLTYWLA